MDVFIVFLRSTMFESMCCCLVLRWCIALNTGLIVCINVIHMQVVTSLVKFSLDCLNVFPFILTYGIHSGYRFVCVS
jgi:hypothetical protein